MNLRKDHYRSVPGNATVCQRRTRSLAAAGSGAPAASRPRPKACQTRGPSVARRIERRGGGRCLRRLLLFSLFFSLRGQTLSSAPASPPRANRPRKAAASARNQTHRRPAPTARTGRLTGIAELASLLRSAWAGCSKSSPPATATAGRPEVSPRYDPTFRFVSERRLSKNTKRVYNS